MNHQKLEELYNIAVAKCNENEAWLWERHFAEAIIAECISLFDGTREMKTVGLLSHDSIIKKIKNHFGIES